ncbi:MAG: transcription-repair coupling factor [Deltaproteobacteria bacterium]|nr:transcription-repair coupling factor [Deltaproteobacteria bacterium]
MNQNQVKFSTDAFINKVIESKNGIIECLGLYGSEKAYFISKLYDKLNKKTAVIVPSLKDAEKVFNDLCFFNNKHNIINFPAYNITPFKSLSYENETTALRIGMLYNFITDYKPFLAVIPAEALLQKVVPKKALADFAELILSGEDIDREALIEKLTAGGYIRTPIVEESGDFCVRGEIIDIFSPRYQNPIRISLFGETVESLRFFSPVTQRTLQEIEEAVILPCAEAVIKADLLDSIIEKIESIMRLQNFSAYEIDPVIQKIQTGRNYSDISKFIPIIYNDANLLQDYLGDAVFINYDKPALQRSVFDLEEKIYKDYKKAIEEKRFCVEPDKLYIKWSQYEKEAEKKILINFTGSFSDLEKERTDTFQFDIEDNSLISGQLRSFYEKDYILKPLAEWINAKKKLNCKTGIICSTDIQADRIKSLMAPYGIGFKFINFRPPLNTLDNQPFICKGDISSGFFWQNERLALITEDEIFGSKKRGRKIKKQEHKLADFLLFDDLKEGDSVVHTEHGIGRYAGIIKLKSEGIENDFLVIEYKDQDKLYIPTDRLSTLQKYIGIEGISPALDKLGGTAWENTKKKLKKSADKIAKDLVKIYAARKTGQGYAFSAPDSYFEDFEASFPYEETPDQIKAINDVLFDMQSETPMDRLICGDIGYGKTEAALRASFLAANDGKQTAILAPTTILARQHYEVFKKRFAKYPVTVGCLSRLQDRKQSNEIIENLKTGKIDIIIGTHRLLQKNIEFKDLRLLIIDEEQRFGVKHKEALKKIRKTIDVLAITATPIPRTLHLSMIGIRDISVIATRPEGRKSIITHVCEFDANIVQEAVTKEIERGGQVFFVHNNIEKIFSIANFIKRLIPDARIGVGHGQLEKKELEKVMDRFIAKEINVLVCTTIIESGLDIAAANTIIIDRADCFGLSQIYQLRGRVGRSHRQAYAYLFTRKGAMLTQNAQRRLKVLMEHTKLGSGFKIAINDLQIRGGGTILGASQSGKIAAVGYEMFLKIIEEAIADIKGEPVVEKLDPKININISAFIDESYMEDMEQRLAAYKKLSDITDIEQLVDFNKELEDRYGKLPKITKNLFFKILFKVLAIKAGIKRLDISDSDIIIHFSQEHIKEASKLINLAVDNAKQFRFASNNILKAVLLKKRFKTDISYLNEIKNILKRITHNVILKG